MAVMMRIRFSGEAGILFLQRGAGPKSRICENAHKKSLKRLHTRNALKCEINIIFLVFGFFFFLGGGGGGVLPVGTKFQHLPII